MTPAIMNSRCYGITDTFMVFFRVLGIQNSEHAVWDRH